jgi:hypothetical protein
MERYRDMRASVHAIQEMLRHLDPAYMNTDDLASLVVALSPLPRAVYAPADFARRIQSYLNRRDEHRRDELDVAIASATAHLESDPEWPNFRECVRAAWEAVHALQKFACTVSMFPHEIALAALKKWSPWPDPHVNFLVFGQMTILFLIDTTDPECISTRIAISEIFTTTFAWPTLEIHVRINRISGCVITDSVRIIAPDPLACTESDGLMAMVAAHAVGATIIDIPPPSNLQEIRDRLCAKKNINPITRPAA